MRFILFLVAIAVAAVMLEHAADAHIIRKTRPLRIRLGEQDAVLSHMFDDIEDQRDLNHLKRHSIEDVRKQGHKDALQAEREDEKE